MRVQFNNIYSLSFKAHKKEIRDTDDIQRQARKTFPFISSSYVDEFYLTAGKKLPKDKYYEEYSQIENGVGMLKSFECEVDAFLKTLSSKEREIKRSGPNPRLAPTS